MIAAEIRDIEKRFQWFNHIPSDWEVMRLKNICEGKLRYGINIPANKYSDDGVRFLRTTDINEDGEVIPDGIYIPKKEVSESYILQKGDLLFSRSGTVGRCYLHDSDEEYCYAGFLVKFKPKNYLLSKLLYYSSLTKEFKYQIFSEAIESTISNFNGNKYAVLRVAFPSDKKELERLIDYLDFKYAKLKKFIQTKQRFIESLKEQRQSIITNAVTKGIDEVVKMKETGIDWMPQIPEHWEIRRLKTLVDFKSGESITSEKIFLNGNYSVYGGNGLRGYTKTYTNEGDYVLIGRQGALCGNINYANGKFFASEHAVVVYPKIKLEYFWLGETLRIMNLNQYSMAAAQPGLAINNIRILQICVPPLNEQKCIVEYIKTETKILDIAIGKAEREIELIKEYREAMIAEAVTGKMKL